MAQVHVVPHTHWDREWYLPFAVYRRRLLTLIDDLLTKLDEEPGLRFHLDGQMALVDDYLELRPDRLPALQQAARDGRVSLGPWYTLPDEHLVSGESLIRNLELGLARARRIGEPMLVGYVPDQFGHTAQLPQILRRFGIETAVLWRGVPAEVDSQVFTWEALDGSSVEVVHMRNGYGHGRELPADPGELAARLDSEVERQHERNPKGPWLVMSGDDHRPVPAGLSLTIGEVPGRWSPEISSLADFIASRPAAGSRWRGELHSPNSSFVLKGTLSARFPLKLRHAALERRLERYLEPVWALSDQVWPARELDYCWRQLILNSAHDSICGCSIDQVHEQADERIGRASTLADRLWERLGRGEGWFNPSLFEREGVPPLGVGPGEQPSEDEGRESLGLELEDEADHGDEYTFDPPAGASPVRRPLKEARLTRRRGEAFVRVSVEIENHRPDHRLRLLVPADTSGGAWAGTAFGSLHRPFRRPGTDSGLEFDLPTDPARLWVDSGGVAVLLAGPFEYELLEDAIAVTLLRSVGWLSRADLRHRPGHAGPGVATPGAQMLGSHRFELAIYRHEGGWEEASVPRQAEIFAHPLVPAPAATLRTGPSETDPGVILSALRRWEGRLQLRTYRALEPWRIEDRWLEGED
jgi:alpha-mannosidase